MRDRRAKTTRMRTSGSSQGWRVSMSSVIGAPLAVHFSQNDVQRPDDGYHVGHQMAAHHLVEGFQVDKRRRANPQPIRLGGAVADDVVAEPPRGRFEWMVHLARRGLCGPPPP